MGVRVPLLARDDSTVRSSDPVQDFVFIFLPCILNGLILSDEGFGGWCLLMSDKAAKIVTGHARSRSAAVSSENVELSG